MRRRCLLMLPWRGSRREFNPTSRTCARNETPLPHLPPPEKRTDLDLLVGPLSYDSSAPEENPGRYPADQTKGPAHPTQTCSLFRGTALEGPVLRVKVDLRYPVPAKLFSERLGDKLATMYLYMHMDIRPRAPEPAPLRPSTLEILRPHVGCTACSLVSLRRPA
jgi:hypothetical protein